MPLEQLQQDGKQRVLFIVNTCGHRLCLMKNTDMSVLIQLGILHIDEMSQKDISDLWYIEKVTTYSAEEHIFDYI